MTPPARITKPRKNPPKPKYAFESERIVSGGKKGGEGIQKIIGTEPRPNWPLRRQPLWPQEEVRAALRRVGVKPIEGGFSALSRRKAEIHAEAPVSRL